MVDKAGELNVGGKDGVAEGEVLEGEEEEGVPSLGGWERGVREGERVREGRGRKE